MSRNSRLNYAGLWVVAAALGAGCGSSDDKQARPPGMVSAPTGIQPAANNTGTGGTTSAPSVNNNVNNNVMMPVNPVMKPVMNGTGGAAPTAPAMNTGRPRG